MLKLFKRRSSESEIFECVRKGNTRQVRKLIASGVSIECFDVRGRTPLCLAAKCADLEMIRILVEAGADVNVVAAGGRTPIYHAIYSKSLTAVKLLIELGARTDVKDGIGYSPWKYASTRALTKMLDVLKDGHEAAGE